MNLWTKVNKENQIESKNFKYDADALAFIFIYLYSYQIRAKPWGC